MDHGRSTNTRSEPSRSSGSSYAPPAIPTVLAGATLRHIIAELKQDTGNVLRDQLRAALGIQ